MLDNVTPAPGFQRVNDVTILSSSPGRVIKLSETSNCFYNINSY